MSVSDIIALISLVIAIQIILMYFYQKGIDSILEKQNKDIDQILINKHLLKNNHEIFIGALSEFSSMQRLYGSLIVRLSEHTDLSNSEKISSEIGRYDYLLEKSIHEVNIFSAEEVRCQSASRALAEEYGDLYSLELMQKCNEEIYRNQNPDLQASIMSLKKRVSMKLAEK